MMLDEYIGCDDMNYSDILDAFKTELGPNGDLSPKAGSIEDLYAYRNRFGIKADDSLYYVMNPKAPYEERMVMTFRDNFDVVLRQQKKFELDEMTQKFTYSYACQNLANQLIEVKRYFQQLDSRGVKVPREWWIDFFFFALPEKYWSEPCRGNGGSFFGDSRNPKCRWPGVLRRRDGYTFKVLQQHLQDLTEKGYSYTFLDTIGSRYSPGSTDSQHDLCDFGSGNYSYLVMKLEKDGQVVRFTVEVEKSEATDVKVAMEYERSEEAKENRRMRAIAKYIEECRGYHA